MKFSGVSIIICCYNSSHRLPQTLKYLAHQQLADDIAWEIIVINNASEDDTKEVAIKEWNSYSSKIVLRVIDEPVPGLNNARKRGVEEAKYDIIIFCDDDNWLDKNFI